VRRFGEVQGPIDGQQTEESATRADSLLLLNNGQPFPNPVREGLPTIHPKQQQDQLKEKAPLGWL